jgi:hypothetical protein
VILVPKLFDKSYELLLLLADSSIDFPQSISILCFQLDDLTLQVFGVVPGL